MSQIKKLRRFATYSFLLVLATLVSALLGNKKADHKTVDGSFFIPSAHADLPTSGDVPGSFDAIGGNGPGAPSAPLDVNGTDAPSFDLANDNMT